MDYNHADLRILIENEKISLKNAPHIISEFIINNKIQICNDVEIIHVIIKMSEQFTFLFSNDQWGNVLKYVRAFVGLKTNFLDDCVKTIKTRTDESPIGHLSVIELKKILNIDPPPYSN